MESRGSLIAIYYGKDYSLYIANSYKLNKKEDFSWGLLTLSWAERLGFMFRAMRMRAKRRLEGRI